MTAEEIRALGRQRDKELSNSAATGSAFLGAAAILQAEALYEIAAQLAELNATNHPACIHDAEDEINLWQGRFYAAQAKLKELGVIL